MAKSTPGNDDAIEGTTSDMTPYQKFINYSLQRADVENTDWDAHEITESQITDIMSAADEDALFAAMETAGLTGLRDLPNATELEVHGYRLVRGNLGIGVYAVIDAVNMTTGGENVALDTGIERVIAFLRMAEVMELFPLHVVVTKKTTGSGNELITLSRPAKRPVSSRTSE
jgi:hypothetical protein